MPTVDEMLGVETMDAVSPLDDYDRRLALYRAFCAEGQVPSFVDYESEEMIDAVMQGIENGPFDYFVGKNGNGLDIYAAGLERAMNDPYVTGAGRHILYERNIRILAREMGCTREAVLQRIESRMESIKRLRAYAQDSLASVEPLARATPYETPDQIAAALRMEFFPPDDMQEPAELCA